MRSSFLSLAFCLLPVIAAIGCTEEFVATGGSGGGASTTGGGGAQTTSTSSTSSTSTAACALSKETDCDACLLKSCSDTYCECAGDQGCVDLLKCVDGAQSQADLEKCAIEHPSSIARAGRLLTCGSPACSVCQIPPVTPCLACEYDKCRSQIDACLGKEACVGYAKCLGGCVAGDQACKTACYDAHPAGANPLNALVACAGSKCSMVCP